MLSEDLSPWKQQLHTFGSATKQKEVLTMGNRGTCNLNVIPGKASPK